MRTSQDITTSATRRDDCITDSDDGRAGALFVALELSWATWELALSDGRGGKPRRRRVDGRDLPGLQRELALARQRFKLAADAPVYTCYEAGRDGFWLHRWLTSVGIENVIVDSSSIEVNRRRRRPKNDKLDAGKLLTMLMRYHHGEEHVWSVLRTPGVEDEDVRQRQRELETLRDERTAHINRIRGLLATHGLDVNVDAGLRDRLSDLTRRNDGGPLPEHLRARLERELERMALATEQIRAIEKQRRDHERREADAHARQVRQLRTLYGIGEESAWLTVTELFGWRRFRNRKQLAAVAGLTSMPFDSGGVQRDQGISKAGNKRVRRMMVQIAWGWLRHQPNSELSQWYQRRFGSGSKRQRKIGIVALARKLLVKLWQYLTTGAIPQGAVLKPT